MRSVYALSICGRLTLNLHSLNNEGTEGNQQLTRQVTIADEKGQPHTVNAISGDMLKHIQVEHLTNLVIRAGLPICEPARRFDSNRIAAVRNLAAKGVKDGAVTDTIIQQCAVTEMAGVLLTENRSTARNSVIEWAWLVGLPEKNTTENFIHLKRVPDAGDAGANEAANLGQNLFHRPVNSGVYAAVVNIEAARIGFNDFTRAVPNGVTDRNERYKALLQSLLYTFLEPNGAQRNTQNPHISGFDGVIAVSYDVCPAPAISPLKEGYDKQLEGIASTLNGLLDGGDEAPAIEIKPFNSLETFASAISEIINDTQPWTHAKKS